MSPVPPSSWKTYSNPYGRDKILQDSSLKTTESLDENSRDSVIITVPVITPFDQQTIVVPIGGGPSNEDQDHWNVTQLPLFSAVSPFENSMDAFIFLTDQPSELLQ
jgi:hypothetical protein